MCIPCIMCGACADPSNATIIDEDHCPECGSPVPIDALSCPYCYTYLYRSVPGASSSQPAGDTLAHSIEARSTS